MIAAEPNPGRAEWKLENPICLSVADIKTAVFSDDPSLHLRLDQTARLFAVDAGDADVTVHASWGNAFTPPPAAKVFDSGALWRLYRENGNHVFSFTSEYYGTEPYKTAYFDSGFASGHVYINHQYFDATDSVYPLEYPLDELLMMNLLASGRGVEIHSSGVITPDGKGLLFAGQSGAGKTTMSRIWQNQTGARILSDDRIIIRKLEGRFWMYGTPWHGEAALAASARIPLTAMFFLRHSNRNEIVSQSNAIAAARMLACGFPPFFNPLGLEFTLGFYDELTRSVPCIELGFVPDPSVVDFLEGLDA